MLRCPPSRISLNKDDLAGLDHRLAVKQHARLSRPNAANVRLSPGPGHQTRLAVVQADQNVGRKRAISALSEAEFYDESHHPMSGALPSTLDGNTMNVRSTLIRCVQDSIEVQSALFHEAAGTLENVGQQRASPRRPFPLRRRGSSLPLDDGPGIAQLSGNDHSTHPQYLDGISESRPGLPFSFATPSMPFTQCSTALQEVHSDALPVSGRAPTTLPPLACGSLHTEVTQHGSQRRGYIPHHDNFARELTSYPPSRRPASGGNDALELDSSVPQLMLPEGVSLADSASMLDPGAPVFVPRVRFGSTMWSSMDSGRATFLDVHQHTRQSMHDGPNLRVRSSSERNTDVRLRSDNEDRTDEPAGAQTHVRPHVMAGHRSRTFDQNTLITEQAPIADRYPSMRPLSSLSSENHSDGLHPPSRAEPNGFSRSVSATFDLPYASDIDNRRALNHHIHRAFLGPDHEMGIFAPRTRSVSPAVSVSSRSTPNLLRLPLSAPQRGSRESSLSWINTRSRHSSSYRAPSVVSAASGATRDGSLTDSRRGLDAAEEFLRRRNSPLDELTERFSRMRSVGRSWERTPGNHPRVSLLFGDPFRQGPSPDAPPMPRTTPIAHCIQEPSEQGIAEEDQAEVVTSEDIVALSLALPPSSPISPSSQALPSTPPVQAGESLSPRSPLKQLSPSKPQGCREDSIKRKPVPQTTTTPKLSIYNDSQPPNTQPQTEGEIAGARRAKNRSDTVVGQSPLRVGRAMVEGPPVIPERGSHRNTYPPSTSQNSIQTASVTAEAPGTDAVIAASETDRRQRNRRRAQSHRSIEQVENNLEGQLPGLEDDRRTWLNRREAGTMDITPPKEGRFERYLS